MNWSYIIAGLLIVGGISVLLISGAILLGNWIKNSQVESRGVKRVNISNNIVIPAVPRNDKGWPTIEPEEFTDNQLILEAMSWQEAALDTARNTVSNMMWDKYTDELIKRNRMSIYMKEHYLLPEITRETTK